MNDKQVDEDDPEVIQDRNMRIYRARAIDGRTFLNIADDELVSGSRIRQIFMSTQARLYHEIAGKVIDLSAEVDELRLDPGALEKEVARMRQRKKEVQERKAKIRQEAPEWRQTNGMVLGRLVDDLDLSVRTQNCLQSANIRYVGELVQKSEWEMLKIRHFGRKCLKEIKDVLLDLGLSLGMSVDEFDPCDAKEGGR